MFFIPAYAQPLSVSLRLLLAATQTTHDNLCVPLNDSTSSTRDHTHTCKSHQCQSLDKHHSTGIPTGRDTYQMAGCSLLKILADRDSGQQL
ncbi:hypothetical protein GALMADRAFT_251187, partial [Galerina marginata CBS 339.88]